MVAYRTGEGEEGFPGEPLERGNRTPPFSRLMNGEFPEVVIERCHHEEHAPFG